MDNVIYGVDFTTIFQWAIHQNFWLSDIQKLFI